MRRSLSRKETRVLEPAPRAKTSTGLKAHHEGVHIKVERSSGQPWRITFSVFTGQRKRNRIVGVLSLGHFPPQELFPVIEFHWDTSSQAASILQSLSGELGKGKG